MVAARMFMFGAAAGAAMGDLAAGAACAPGDEVCQQGGDASALLQFRSGVTTTGTCAGEGHNPYARGYDHQCCSGLNKVKNKYSSSTCSFLCLACTAEGGNATRYCDSGCGGCNDEYQDGVDPCCDGLVQASNGECQSSGEKCASEDQNPDHGYGGVCCPDLYKVINKWHSSTCSYECLSCSTAGESIYRYCGNHCGHCEDDGDGLVPCCPGLSPNRNGVCHDSSDESAAPRVVDAAPAAAAAPVADAAPVAGAESSGESSY